MPRIAESISDIWNLHLAAKYLDKTFGMFDEKALSRSPSSEIRQWIYGEIQNRFGSDDRNLDSAATATGPTQGESSAQDKTE
jgi:hypothetical protein